MLGYRARQCAADLWAVAAGSEDANDRGAVDRLSPDALGLELADIFAGAATEQLEAMQHRYGQRLMHAAQAPDADRPLFTRATALLLLAASAPGPARAAMPRLWRQFRVAYYVLDHRRRAAIVQGYLQAERMGFCILPRPLPSAAHLGRTVETVERELRRTAGQNAETLIEALSAGTDRAAAANWHHHLIRGSAPGQGGSQAFLAELSTLAGTAQSPAMLPAAAMLLAEALPSGDRNGWFQHQLWPRMIDHWLADPACQPLLHGLRHLYEDNPEWGARVQLPGVLPLI